MRVAVSCSVQVKGRVGERLCAMNIITRANPANVLNCSVITSLYRACVSTVAETIEQLVKKNKVVIFMKGVPEEPRCGFSNAVVQILRMHGVTYDAHDVLKDEELRKGVTFSILVLNNVICIMLEVVCDISIRFCYN